MTSGSDSRIIERPGGATTHRPLRADDVVAALRGQAAHAAGAARGEELRQFSIAALKALAVDPELGPRASLAATTVEIRLVDVPGGAPFAILLDRHPLEAIEGPYSDAEVRLYLTAPTLEALRREQLQPAIAIADGLIGYEGPVRKLLRVLPLLMRVAPTSTSDEKW